jgi:hypothetical protein
MTLPLWNMIRRKWEPVFPSGQTRSVCPVVMLNQSDLIMIRFNPSHHDLEGHVAAVPYFASAAAITAGGSPIAHWRQSGTVQLAGQLPPSAMNNAAVSARRLASV